MNNPLRINSAKRYVELTTPRKAGIPPTRRRTMQKKTL
jgi:hypothetical protein